MTHKLTALVVAAALVAPACSSDKAARPKVSSQSPSSSSTTIPTTTVPSTTTSTVAVLAGMPPVTDSNNIYAAAGVDGMRSDLAALPPRVYVPNSLSGTVSVIDPATFKVIDTFATGPTPQHIVPSWDLSTLWVNNNGGSLTRIDPSTSKPTETIATDDPYNMYFTPDGAFMIIVAEGIQRLDFRDAKTLELKSQLNVPCPGINHMDYSADGTYFIASCEFGHKLIKVDTRDRKVIGELDLGSNNMPQDVRLNPRGKLFYVADMMADGLHVIDGSTFTKVGFIETGIGAHAVYPSRDGQRMFISNRGSHDVNGSPGGPGSISVVDPAVGEIGAVEVTWPLPDGGSPDMGNVTADGKQLWLSGRYDAEVYVIDTATGALLARIPVGNSPHGLTVWPQPGRYSLGHTGNIR